MDKPTFFYYNSLTIEDYLLVEILTPSSRADSLRTNQYFRSSSMGYEKFNLENKVAIITGSTKGIGFSIAKAFLESGAKVAISSRKEENVNKGVEELKALGDVIGIPCHVGKLDQIQNLISKTIEQFEKLDILVNNAAVSPAMGPIMNLQDSVWDKIMETNLKSVFWCTREAAKVMKKQKQGKIINIASTAAFKADPILGAYGVSKAGVVMLTKVFGRELAADNINVNCVAPGMTKTQFSQPIWDNPGVAKMITDMLPARRIAEPDEVAGAVVFLASDAASYFFGQTIPVDGGSLI